MKTKILFPVLFCLLAAACSSGSIGSSNVPLYSNGGFNWRDFAKVSQMHTQLVDTSGGQSLYMITYAPEALGITLSDGRVVTGGIDGCFRWGGPLVEECYNAVVRAGRREGFSSRTQLVGAAQRVILEDGRCTWVGYDAGLDSQARAIGQLAAQNDNRFFFTRLACG